MAITLPRYDESQVKNLPIDAGPRAQGSSPSVFGAGLGAGLSDVGNTGLKMVAQREREQEAIKQQQQAELEKMAELRDNNKAKNMLLNMENDLNTHEQAIYDNPDIPPEDYPSAIASKGNELMDSIRKQVTEKTWLTMEPHYREQVFKAQNRMFTTGQKEIDDQAYAEDLSAADAVVNNPLKSASEKITILKSPDFFADSGRPAHEIEKEREHRIALVADGETRALFNAARSDINALSEVKSILTEKTKSGTYAYLPEMQQIKREEFINSIDGKIEVQQRLDDAEAKRRQGEARQAAQELVAEYREKVNAGWMPNTLDDFKFVKQVRNASGASPSLSRQYNDSYTKMTSFASREAFRIKDPLGAAAAEKGIVLPPINVTAPLPQQIQQRVAIANKLGVRAIFKGDEIHNLVERLKTMDTPSMMTQINTLNKDLGGYSGSTFSTMAEQLKTKEPSLANLFKIVSTGDMYTARQYADGRNYIIAEKKDTLQTKISDIKKELEEKISSSLGTALQAMPQSREASKDAVAVSYIGAAVQRGLSLDKVDPALLNDVQKRVIGETVATGKTSMFTSGSWKNTVVPRDMTPDQFLNNIKSITPISIGLAGGVQGMTDEEAATYLKNSAWHEVGAGYSFYKNGKMLMDKSGKPFQWRF